MPRYVCRLVLLFVPDSVLSTHKDNEQSTQFYTSFPVWVLQVKYGLNFFFFAFSLQELGEQKALI